MITLLVIGGSGFFGKSILDAFWRDLLEPWGVTKIIVMARNATSTLKNYPELTCLSAIYPEKKSDLNRVVELLDADICTCTSLPYADYVIHAAASTDARSYISCPAFERENIQSGVANFCILAKKYLRESKIVYISSGAVYGVQPDSILNLSESSLLLPIKNLPVNKQDYAAAKRDGELLIRNLGANGLDVIITRCFSFIGKYLPRDQHFAIGNFIEDGLRGSSIEVKAKTLVFRSYMHADDLVTWLLTLAMSAGSNCPVVNVGSADGIEIVDVAKKIAEIFGVNVKVAARVESIADRYVPSVNMAESLFCTQAYNFDQSLSRVIEAVSLRKLT